MWGEGLRLADEWVCLNADQAEVGLFPKTPEISEFFFSKDLSFSKHSCLIHYPEQNSSRIYREGVRIPLYRMRFSLNLLVLSSMLYPWSTLSCWSLGPLQVQFFRRLNFSSPIGEGKVVTICVDQKRGTWGVQALCRLSFNQSFCSTWCLHPSVSAGLRQGGGLIALSPLQGLRL